VQWTCDLSPFAHDDLVGRLSVPPLNLLAGE